MSQTSRETGGMFLAAEHEYEHLGETAGIADHDHDLSAELNRRLDPLWRYDQYIANAERPATISSMWCPTPPSGTGFGADRRTGSSKPHRRSAHPGVHRRQCVVVGGMETKSDAGEFGAP